jgi:hypothetical protein
MPRHRVLALSVAAFAGVLLWTHWPSHADITPSSPATVRLYSNGQVVGQWEAVGPGQIEGDTFVFPVRKGARDLDVRISGTFSFEEQP